VEFLIKNGSERFIEECRDRMFKIRALQEYNYYEQSIDKGSGVREKSKQVVDLLGNNDAIRSEREKARALRNKFVGIDSRNVQGGSGGYGGYNGGGSSYDSQQSGSGGRYDSYDSGSGSRYGGDSYNSNNNNNTRRASTSDYVGRYGGGSYDSEKPPRYGDDVPERSTTNRYNDEEEEVKPPTRSKSISGTAAPSTAGKIKINIKKVDSAPAARVEEPNLLGSDIDLIGGFESAPAPALGGIPLLAYMLFIPIG
jgi:epsin